MLTNVMANKFTVGLVQMRCTTNAEENLSRAIDKIREAARARAQIISLHELSVANISAAGKI